MSWKRGTTIPLVVGIVGTVLFVVLGYLVHRALTGPQGMPTVYPSVPAAEDTVQPLSTSTPTPPPQPPPATSAPVTSAPSVTNTPGPCIEDLVLVEHLSYDDLDLTDPPVVRRGKKFTKSWRIRNSGTCTWDPSYSIVYVDGNHAAAQMNGALIVLHGQTEPSETYDVEVKLVAPREPGLYQGYWQMRNAAGVYLGERLPVAIQVLPLPTATPTGTPLPRTTIQFKVDRTRITGGECALFSWTVDHAQAVYFYSEGQRWQAHGVPFVEQRQACPEQTTAYYLRVVRASGWPDLRRLVVHVEQPPEAPQIARFTVEPALVPEGGCVTLVWEAEGRITSVQLLRDEVVQWENAPLSGSLSDCPPGTGEVVYAIEVTGPGGTVRSQHTVRVGTTPTPTPEPLSRTEWLALAIGKSMPAPAERPLTVLFGQQDAAGQGTVAGWGGCNTYSATYRQSGALLTISQPTAGTLVCEQVVLAQEQRLLDALHAAATLSQSDGQLTLWNHAGEVVLNLAASKAAAP